MSSKKSIQQMLLAAMLLALALVLPFATGQIPEIGNALCPMHLPVLICGFFCGPLYATIVGFISPLLRFVLFSAPPMPMGIAMSFELATYGFVSAILYKLLTKNTINIYLSLIGAMIAGRVVWGCIRVIMFGLGQLQFNWTMFIAGALLNAIPGIILQILLIPPLVIFLKNKNKA